MNQRVLGGGNLPRRAPKGTPPRHSRTEAAAVRSGTEGVLHIGCAELAFADRPGPAAQVATPQAWFGKPVKVRSPDDRGTLTAAPQAPPARNPVHETEANIVAHPNAPGHAELVMLADPVTALQNRALAAYDERLVRHRDAIRNEAVESIGRVPWWRLVTSGCTPPVGVLVIQPMIYAATHLLRAHIEALATTIGKDARRRDRFRRLATERWLTPIQVPAEARRVQITRVWNEPAPMWIRRFEAELRASVDALHRDHFRPEFEARLEAIEDTATELL